MTADPSIRWWQGPVACDLCGYGTPRHPIPRAASVIPIDAEHDGPIVPMECPDCGNMTLHPADETEARR